MSTDLPLPSDSSSLDHSETNSHPLQSQSRAQHRLHAPVQELRTQIVTACWESFDPALCKRARKMGMCGIAPLAKFHANALPTVSLGRCRDRLCPTCAKFRASKLSARITPIVQRARSVRMVTLTMPQCGRDLGERVDDLHAAMRKLRARKSWKERVTGGVFVVEVTRGQADKHWHVHAHLLIEGSYYSFDALKHDWSESVGAISNVWINAVHDREKGVGYVTKYLSKGTDVASWSDAHVRMFAKQMHRRRIVGTFGKWHRVKLGSLDQEDSTKATGTVEVSMTALEDFIDQDDAARRKAAPLLTQISKTWRLLLAPHTPQLRIERDRITPDLFEDIRLHFLALQDGTPPNDQDAPSQEPPPQAVATLWTQTYR